jgi:hypothetical protein
MSDPPDNTKKLLVTVLFIVIGLPPGLCAMWATPATIGLLRASDSQSQAYAVLFGVPALVGYVIFGGLLWWLIRTWRTGPS